MANTERWVYVGRRWLAFVKSPNTPKLGYLWLKLGEGDQVQEDDRHAFQKQILAGRLAGIGSIYEVTRCDDNPNSIWLSGTSAPKYIGQLQQQTHILRWEAEARESETRARGERIVTADIEQAEQLDRLLDALGDVYARLDSNSRPGWIGYIIARMTQRSAQRLAELKADKSEKAGRQQGYRRGFQDAIKKPSLGQKF